MFNQLRRKYFRQQCNLIRLPLTGVSYVLSSWIEKRFTILFWQDLKSQIRNNQGEMNIAQEIRKRRQELRLTQQALADMSGVSVRMIKSIEGNYANPSLKTVEKLLLSLGLGIEITETRKP